MYINTFLLKEHKRNVLVMLATLTCHLDKCNNKFKDSLKC